MFGRGIRLFRLFGIPVYLDYSFFVIVPLFAWILASNLPYYAQAANLAEETRQVFGIAPGAADDGGRLVTPRMARPGLALAFGALVTLGLYASVLIHEFGHALTARGYGVQTERITLWFLGGVAALQRMPRQRGAEAVVAIAGPLTSLAVAAACAAVAFAAPRDWYLWQLSARSLILVNVVLAVFNLIPALPLDGGRVLRSLLALAMPHARATGVAAIVSKAIAGALFVFAVLNVEVMLILIAVFIWMAVNAETRQTAVEDLLGGVRVGDVMVRDVAAVPADMPAGALLEEMIRRRHTGFPVVDAGGRVVGIIGLRDFPHGFDPGAPVGALARPDFCRVAVDAPAQQAFEAMGQRDFARCLVLDPDGRLQGLLTKADLMRLLQVRAAAMTAASRRAPDEPYQLPR